jgi:hypothetical protein
MTHKDINEIEDENLKRILLLIKKIELTQKKLRKIINKTNENE